MLDKRGQGLSLNVIIIAALALIVLVILVVIFTGRIGIFESGVSKEGNAELVQYRSLRYGDCHPPASAEQTFVTTFNQAETPEAKDLAEASFESEIDRCRESGTKEECEAVGGCKWK